MNIFDVIRKNGDFILTKHGSQDIASLELKRMESIAGKSELEHSTSHKSVFPSS